MNDPDALEGDAGLLASRWPYALLVAFCLLLWTPGLFTLPPTDRDESRFAQASKQMIESGDGVRIMNGATPRNRKPIGIYWLQVPFAAAAKAAGVATENPIWPYRLPSLLGAMLAVVTTFGLGQHLVGRRAALLAAGMLASCVLLAVEAHLAKTDAALLGATAVVMGLLGRAYVGPATIGRGHAAAFWLAMGAGTLLKGPITPMVAALACVTLAIWDRRAGWLRALRPGWGVALTLLGVLPWFVAIGITTHGAFFDDSVGGDLGRKLSSGDDAHGGPPGLHLLLLPVLAFPSSLAVLRGLPDLWRCRDDATRFLVAWIVPSWTVLEAIPTKLPHYTLPLYPALFLMAARWATHSAHRPAPGRWGALAPSLTVVAAALIALATIVLPLALHVSPWVGVPATAAAILAGWLATRPGGVMLAVAAMPLVTGALLGLELPGLQPLWIAPRIESVLIGAGLAGCTVGAVGFHEPSLMFLAGTRTELLASGAAGADALETGEAAVLIVSDRDEAAFQAEAARLELTAISIGHVDGFNYSNGRFVGLTLYRRS